MKTPERLYVAGFWQLPGNVKRDISHYLDTAERTADMITNSPLIFFCSGKPEETVVADRFRARGVRVEMRELSLPELPGRPLAEKATRACERMIENPPALIRGEKGEVHQRRDYQQSGRVTYLDLQAIWLSKVLLVHSLADSVDASSTLSWIDVSLSRFKGLRSGWNFARQKDAPGKILCYSTRMSAQGFPVNVSGSFLSGSPEAWNRLGSAYAGAAEVLLAQDYAHDEETILSLTRRNRPDLFKEIGGPLPYWRRAAGRMVKRISSGQ